ncbi:TIGR03617 family F420-dependent LLM class oxidoreductase [Blastococcus sp. SYSU D00820]
MRVDVQLDAPPDRAAARARELADTGVDGVFTFEGRHDAFLPLALTAPVVPTDLMTNVAIALPRSPLHLAHLAADLQLLSRGRFRLGLGSQTRPHIERRYGSTWSRPAARMREAVLAVRELLTAWQEERPPAFRGEFTEHTLMPPMFAPPPNPYGVPPVLLGALGPLMTAAAAEVADGLLVMPFHSSRHFRERTLPAVAEGLARAGRTEGELAIVPQVVVATGRTPAELSAASDGARRLIAFYAATPAYRPVLEVEGCGHLQQELHRRSRAGDVDGMAALVDDELLATFAVRGTPEECAAEIARRFGDVAERVCVYFPGYEVAPEAMAALAAALHEA